MGYFKGAGRCSGIFQWGRGGVVGYFNGEG